MFTKYYRASGWNRDGQILLAAVLLALILYDIFEWKYLNKSGLLSGLFVLSSFASYLFYMITHWVRYEDDTWHFRRASNKTLTIKNDDIIRLEMYKNFLSGRKIRLIYLKNDKEKSVKLDFPKSVNILLLQDFQIFWPGKIDQEVIEFLLDVT